jgi:hypothetical protein
LVAHDEEIHQATLNVREWHRWEVVKGFAEIEDFPVENIIEARVA